MASKSPTSKDSVPKRLLIHGNEPIWHKSAPKKVAGAYASGDGWATWQAHLAGRKKPKPLAKLLPGRGWPLDWATADDELPKTKMSEKAILAWLEDANGGQCGLGYALQAISLAAELPKLSATISQPTWWHVLNHLLGTVDQSQALCGESGPLVQQLLGGELPLVLAYQFPEIEPCDKLAAVASQALSIGIANLLDGEGMLEADNIHLLRPLLACWTRCRAIGEKMRGGCWTEDVEIDYQWLVRATLHTTRADGSHVFSTGPTGAWCANLFEAALDLGGDEDDEVIAQQILPRRKRVDEDFELPEAAVHSEWASTAVLQPYWGGNQPRLTVLYPHDESRVELECGGEVLFSGNWDLDVRIDGKQAKPDGDWQEVCWFSDDDVDYLELELDFGVKGLRVQRQMLLAREDGFLMLADAVLSDSQAKIDYRGTLPLCSGVSFKGAEESFEGTICGKKRRAVVMPLAMPEWRAEQSPGDLCQVGQGLQLQQTANGNGLYAPLFFDLTRRRHSRVLTWRRLTVAELLEIQPPEVAAGYRVAIGDEQWLIYRSLTPSANRTLLGHNLSCEMVVARFERTGEVEPMMEIE
jgi:hypothetical protein